MNYVAEWLNLCRNIGLRKNVGFIFQQLEDLYADQQRAYHRIEHIQQGLRELKRVRSVLINPSAVQMAWWYHDAVYNPRSHTNEADSVTLFENTFRGLSMPQVFIEKVRELILITRHDGLPKTLDEKAIVDIDLSILGQESEIFDQYEQQIRIEYIWVPLENYRTARIKILQGFLDRPNIYSLQYFYAKYERQARINLARSITQLKEP